jgi:FkbM family methyltransferase
MFIKFSGLLGYEPSEAVAVLEKAAKDPDTYYLSAESHNRWRGSIDYDVFPMRRVQSMQLVGFGSKRVAGLASEAGLFRYHDPNAAVAKAPMYQAIAKISDQYALVQQYDRTGHRCLRRAVDAIKQNPVLDPHVTVQLFDGSLMKVNVREEVGGILFEHKAYELGLTKFLVGALTEGDVFFDVGAHYGYFSILASNLVGGKGKVYSFEPTPSVADQLRSNVLHLGNVEVHQCAVGEKNGQLGFNDYGADFSAFNSAFDARVLGQKLVPAQRVNVPVSRLDTFCAERGVTPSVLKIDAESSEMLVLDGMGSLIDEIQTVVVELGDFEELSVSGVPRSAEILNRLRHHGYSIFMPSIDGLIAHEILNAPYDYCNAICLRNFPKS